MRVGLKKFGGMMLWIMSGTFKVVEAIITTGIKVIRSIGESREETQLAVAKFAADWPQHSLELAVVVG